MDTAQGDWTVQVMDMLGKSTGDIIEVINKYGRITSVQLGDPVPNSRFQWRDPDYRLMAGQAYYVENYNGHLSTESTQGMINPGKNSQAA